MVDKYYIIEAKIVVMIRCFSRKDKIYKDTFLNLIILFDMNIRG